MSPVHPDLECPSATGSTSALEISDVQLEAQVNRLKKVVNNIEVKLGGTPSVHFDQPVHSPASEDSEAEIESTSSEILIAEEPSHLRSLFQNDWLSVDTRRRNEQLQERRAKASAHLTESIRPALQQLIPSKQETAEMLICKYDWLQMIHGMLLQPAVPNSNRDVLGHYGKVCRPDVDVVALASWLLMVAITAQQVPQRNSHSPNSPGNYQRRVQFARVVSDTIEKLVMDHDRLTGTLQGLGMCIHFVRL